jgi:hypothetical protein
LDHRRVPKKDRFASFGADAFSSTPEELGAFDFAKWAKVVKDANVRVDPTSFTEPRIRRPPCYLNGGLGR